jgi:hypothetical protein
MAIHRLHLDQEDEDFALFAIHCGEAPFKMAFLMNQSLKWQLKRDREDIWVNKSGNQEQYPKYRYVSRHDQIEHVLLSNMDRPEQGDNANQPLGLFDGLNGPSFRATYLMPEFKKVDYLLKIEAPLVEGEIKLLVGQIKSIKEVVSTYLIPHKKIKNINPLIN